MAGARDLASWLVTLELATLPVVALAALPGTRRALAGAVQLVTTSLVSFAMLALGAACWYAATGSPVLGRRPGASRRPRPPSAGCSALAVVLVLGGIAFKLSLVPFHAWTPTTYAGSPLPVTVFLAGVSKVAALAALLVVIQAVTQLGRSALVAVGRPRHRQHDPGQPHGPAPGRRRPAAGVVHGRPGGLGRRAAAVRLVPRRRAPPAGYLFTYLVATLVAFTAVMMTVAAVGARGRDARRVRGAWCGPTPGPVARCCSP